MNLPIRSMHLSMYRSGYNGETRIDLVCNVEDGSECETEHARSISFGPFDTDADILRQLRIFAMEGHSVCCPT